MGQKMDGKTIFAFWGTVLVAAVLIISAGGGDAPAAQ